MAVVNKDSFLEGIRSCVAFNEEFYKRVYGYNICNPGFKDIVFEKLESIGITDGPEQYQRFVDKYEAWIADQERSAAKYLRSQWERDEREVKRCLSNTQQENFSKKPSTESMRQKLNRLKMSL